MVALVIIRWNKRGRNKRGRKTGWRGKEYRGRREKRC